MAPFKKIIFFLVVSIFLASSVHAQENGGRNYFTVSDIERIKAVKALLGSIDTKSLYETIHELEKTRYPHLNLVLREAMAKAYTDIVREINVEGQEKKEWLYSMVCLNMAYLQFGGGPSPPGSTTELNRLIRKKLKEYLPLDVFKQPGFIYRLE